MALLGGSITLISIVYGLLVIVLLTVSCGRGVDSDSIRDTLRKFTPTYILVSVLVAIAIIIIIFQAVWYVLGIIWVFLPVARLSTDPNSDDYCRPWFYYFCFYKLVFSVLIAFVFVVSRVNSFLLGSMLPVVTRS